MWEEVVGRKMKEREEKAGVVEARMRAISGGGGGGEGKKEEDEGEEE